MSQKRMSYSTAQKIVDLYADLLVQRKHHSRYMRHGYSELQGYNIIDVDNALKLLMAYNVFSAEGNWPKTRPVLEKYAEQNAAAIVSFSFHFVPDEFIPALEALDPDDRASMSKSLSIMGDADAEMSKVIETQETHESFLKYCYDVGYNDIDYWEKIYKRLDLVTDPRDPNDLIAICINGKRRFKDIFDKAREPKPNATLQAQQSAKEKNRGAFVKRHRAKIFNIVWFGILFLGLFNSVFQRISLGVIAGLVVVNLLVFRKEDLARWETPFNLILFAALLLGIFYPPVGLYVMIFALLFEVGKTIYHYKKRTSKAA